MAAAFPASFVLRSSPDRVAEQLGRRGMARGSARVSRRTQTQGHAMSAAASTVEALAYQLRGGVEALRDLEAQRRLLELDEAQMREIANRLTKWRWGKFE